MVHQGQVQVQLGLLYEVMFLQASCHLMCGMCT